MQTYVERLTRELQHLEELLATPRSRVSKAAIGWVDSPNSWYRAGRNE
jgi:hypothetical protein